MERARSISLRRRLAGLLCVLALVVLAAGCHHRSKTYAAPEVRRAFAKARLPLDTVTTGRREIAQLLRSSSCGPDDAGALRQAIGHVEAILQAKPRRDSIGGKVVLSAYLFDTAANEKLINGNGYFQDDGCLYRTRKASKVFFESRGSGNLLLVGFSSNNSGTSGAAFRRLSVALGWRVSGPH